MTAINEIGPDIFRLSIYVPDFDMQFNHFLVRDEEPLLFHAGFKAMFPVLRDAVATLINPAKLRHIAWSHFESDECGALNDWLQIAPEAQPVCTFVGKLVVDETQACCSRRRAGRCSVPTCSIILATSRP